MNAELLIPAPPYQKAPCADPADDTVAGASRSQMRIQPHRNSLLASASARLAEAARRIEELQARIESLTARPPQATNV